MPNHPLTGARVGQQTDAPLGGLYLAQVVNEISPHTTPAYKTPAERDAAFTAWVQLGNAMRDGLTCTVAGLLQVYRGNLWRAQQPIIGGARPTHAQVQRSSDETTPLGVFYTLADPGVPYKLGLRYLAPSVANGCQLRVSIVQGPTTVQDNALGTFFVVNNYGGASDLYAARITDTLTGSRRIGAYAQRIGASGDWLLQPGLLDIEVWAAA